MSDRTLVSRLHKFVRYGLETRCFSPTSQNHRISDEALAAARSIRGDGAPAIIIHGLMPRSGTVHVGELLRLHPELHAFPNEIWEFPLLQESRVVLALQQGFLNSYRQNVGKIENSDFMPLLGAALLAYLHQFVPPGKRILLKIPSVAYLDFFFHMFPFENLLVLTRDGRDCVHSTVNTWPRYRFSMVCARWRRAARMVKACHALFGEREGYWLGRFEDAVHDPAVFVRAACSQFGLDTDSYPFESQGGLEVRGSSAGYETGQVTWSPVNKVKGFNPVGRWREWPFHRKWLFKRIAGKQLLDLGYAKDMSW